MDCNASIARTMYRNERSKNVNQNRYDRSIVHIRLLLITFMLRAISSLFEQMNQSFRFITFNMDHKICTMNFDRLRCSDEMNGHEVTPIHFKIHGFSIRIALPWKYLDKRAEIVCAWLLGDFWHGDWLDDQLYKRRSSISNQYHLSLWVRLIQS